MNTNWIKLLLVGLLTAVAPLASAQGLDALLPRPQRMIEGKGMLQPKGFSLHAEVLREDYSRYLDDLGFRSGTYYPTVLEVVLVDRIEGAERGQDEAYTLRVSSAGVYVSATTATGAYRALRTLRQMTIKGQGIPMVTITDWPSWRMRGIMHDVGRTFIPLPELKKQVALMAHFKLNVLHWHLTDDQAWRLESKVYPQLTSIAATERMPAEYYTLAQARELAEWCRQHHVLLIPEITMPGHSSAFQRAMGFGMQTPRGREAVKALLRELAEALPVPYIHIGVADEATFDPSFVSDIVAYIHALGRKAIVWGTGAQTERADMAHLYSPASQPQAGVPTLDTRMYGLSRYDTFSDIVALYNARILGQDYGDDDHAGAILALWNDRYMDTPEQVMGDSHLYASALALAERAWLGGGLGHFDGCTTMLWSRQDASFKAFEAFERRLLHYKRTLLSREPLPYVQQTHAAWQIIGPFPNGGELTKVFPPEQSLSAEARGTIPPPPTKLLSYSYSGQQYTARQFAGSGLYLRHPSDDSTSPGALIDPQPNGTAYAVAWVYSPSRQRVGLMLETQNYSRSESDLPPPQGKWDYRASRVWLNGREIPAPVWTGVHTERSYEIPLGNENASSRRPIPVELRAGWNRLLLKLPVGEFSTPETRLVKWMFTASFVSLDGREALPLRYHYVAD